MKTKLLCALLVQFIVTLCITAAETGAANPQRIRIGVDIRLGYQSCIDSWTPVADYLSSETPEYRFVIVPLASEQDLVRVLESGGVEFLSLNPALELMAEDRFGAVPLATTIESAQGETRPESADALCAGVVIRRADRRDIKNIENIRGLRLAAVKPWSFTGWISQWGFLVDHGIDPSKDLNQVVFQGTQEQVITSVMDGTADVGVVDAEMLLLFGLNGRIAKDSIYMFDRQGQAVPLAPGEYAASTAAYPGRVFSKTAAVSDELSKRVSDALMQNSVNTNFDGMPGMMHWTVPGNTSNVRRLLTRLMGPQFAESPGYPLPYASPAWLYPALSIAAIFAGTIILLLVMRSRFVRRVDSLKEHLQTTRMELAEARAQTQRINTILALADCGIDIIDDNNHIVFADSGLERKYGDWRGKKCHGYFCNSPTPCANCKMPSPTEEQRITSRDLDNSERMHTDDPCAKVHFIEGETTRMIGIPFRDEGGRWLYARIHFPIAAFSGKDEHNINLSEVLQP